MLYPGLFFHESLQNPLRKIRTRLYRQRYSTAKSWVYLDKVNLFVGIFYQLKSNNPRPSSKGLNYLSRLLHYSGILYDLRLADFSAANFNAFSRDDALNFHVKIYKYVTRISHVLRQGVAVSDVLYLTPEGAPHVFRPPSSALSGTGPLADKKGYGFDGVSPNILMDKAGGWSLSPAFDLTYSFNPEGDWTASHQMTMNGKRDNFNLGDFKACAKAASMKRGRAEKIIDEVRSRVLQWNRFADDAGVDRLQRDQIQASLRLGKL